MIRGARLIGVNTRALRNVSGIGNDDFVYNYMQSQIGRFSGTALGAFGVGEWRNAGVSRGSVATVRRARSSRGAWRAKAIAVDTGSATDGG